MSQKDIQIRHEWNISHSLNCNGVYSNSFANDLIPLVKFEIFCYMLSEIKGIVVLSKTPLTSAQATIELQLITEGKTMKIYVDHWLKECVLKYEFEVDMRNRRLYHPEFKRDQRNTYYEYYSTQYRFLCDITWHGLNEPEPRAVGNLHGHLKNFFTTPEFSDMMIVIDEKEIPVHKIILAAYSPVFLAMFKADMMESVNKRIIVNDIEVDIMKKVIEFMYTGVIDPVPEYCGLLSILEVADKYEIMDLRDLCEQKLSRKITLASVLEIFERASSLGVPHLMETVISFMVENKLRIIELEDFADLLCRKPELLLEFVVRGISSH